MIKKLRRKILNNKGAALVTVLIATTFMTIIAASLIYMAYMNYMTKAMRYYTTDTFYTDEYALDELSTHLQEIAARSSDMTAVRNNIESSVGKNSGFYATSHTYWTPSNVQSLITLAQQDANIMVETSPRLCDSSGTPMEDTLIVENAYIKLRGVQITATTDAGYTSTITSDIIIYFPSTAAGTMDINDFSIISESYIDMYQGGSRVFSGNMLIQNKDNPDPNAPAIRVNNGGNMVLLSPHAIVDGDIKLENNSVMHITGDCIVYGKIQIESGSALIVSGKLRQTGGITVGSDCQLIGATTAAQTVARHTNLDSGIVTDLLFADIYLWGYETDAPTNKGFYKTNFEDLCTGGTGNLQMDQVASNGAHAVGMGIGQGGNFPNTEDSLIMLCHDVNITTTNQFRNTTILTSGHITYNTTQGTAYMTKMEDEYYEAAKDLLVCYSVDQIDIESIYSHSTVHFKTGYEPGTISTKDNAASWAETKVDGSRTFVADSGANKNYLPVEYLISENASQILTDTFTFPDNEQDPTNSMIVYELWSKD